MCTQWECMLSNLLLVADLAPALEPKHAAVWLAAQPYVFEVGLGSGHGEHGQPLAAPAGEPIGDADAALQHLLGCEAAAGHDAREALPTAAGTASGSAKGMGVGAAIDEALDRCAAELGVPADKVHMHTSIKALACHSCYKVEYCQPSHSNL